MSRSIDLKKPPKYLFVLPNLFTVSSIFCGLYAILQAISQEPDRFYKAAVAIVFACIFDSADGRVARITKTQSDFGVQLDSLADLISFGVAPAILVYQWALSPFGWLGMAVTFVYVACGAMRLARFNVMCNDGPSTHFVGLPIPLAAAALTALVMLHYRTGGGVLTKQPLMLAVVSLLALLMVSNVPYRSFKKLRLTPKTTPLIVLLILGVVFAIFMTSFSHMFVVVTAGSISFGIAEALFGLVRRKLFGISESEEDDEDSQEEIEAG